MRIFSLRSCNLYTHVDTRETRMSTRISNYSVRNRALTPRDVPITSHIVCNTLHTFTCSCEEKLFFAAKKPC